MASPSIDDPRGATRPSIAATALRAMGTTVTICAATLVAFALRIGPLSWRQFADVAHAHRELAAATLLASLVVHFWIRNVRSPPPDSARASD